MFAKKNPLPEAWTVRPPRWYLKDAEFLSEIGGALAFLGLFLTICLAGQRAAEEGETPDALTSHLFTGMFLITYALTVSGGIMAGMRLATAGGRRPTFLRHLGSVFASLAVSMTLAMAIIWGVTRLVLPLQAFFGWLALTAGFTLLIKMRRRQKASEKPISDPRPVE